MEEIRLTEDDMIAFTYCIHWKEYNKSYYGIRYKRGCRTSDLWTKYFTSSRAVKKFREEFGEPDLIIIDQMFTDMEEARDYEEWILKENNVRYNEYWLNRNDRRAPPVQKGENHYLKNPQNAKKISGKNSWYYKEKNSEVRKTFDAGRDAALKKAHEVIKIEHPMRKLENRLKISGENNHFYGKKRPEMSGDLNPMRNKDVSAKFVGELNSNYDNRLHIFYHSDHGVIISTQNDLYNNRIKNKKNLNAIINGHRNICEGFTYHGIFTDSDICESEIYDKHKAIISRKIVRVGKSGYRGVYKHSCGKWASRIYVGSNKISLGLYHNLSDAVKAVNEAEIRYYGSDALIQNIPES